MTTFVFLTAFLLAFLLTRSSIPVAKRCGVLDMPKKGIKEHSNPTPCLGGFAIWLAFWGAFGICLLTGWSREAVLSAAEGGLWFKLMAGSALIAGAGLLDDIRGFRPLTVLSFQIAAAALLIGSGLKIGLLAEWGLIGNVLTVIWILIVINAFNFMDSMDGHCAGIALIAGGVFWSVSGIILQPVTAVFAAVVTGVMAGFLVWNAHPAKTFLGNNGSQLVGYLFAALSLLAVYRTPAVSYADPIFPLIVLGVPIYDMLSVLTVRMFRGQLFWKGDRNHFAHRLERLGMSVPASVRFSYMVGFTMGALAILSTQVQTVLGKALAVTIFFSLMIIIAWLEYYSATRR